jgi:hypothetical protein
MAVEVTMTGTEAQAATLQHEVSALCESPLPAAMESVLNLYNDDGNDIIIDYLTITVNGLPSGNFSEAFIASVTSQLAAVLQSRALPERSNAPAPAQDGKLIVYKRDAQIVEIESRVELVFFHFLRTGVLLWWTSPDQVKAWKAAMLNLLSASQTTATGLRTLLREHTAARQRFLLQFPLSWQQQVLALLAPVPYARTLLVQRVLEAVFPACPPALFYEWQLGSGLHSDAPFLPLLHDAVVQLQLSASGSLPAQQVEERLAHAAALAEELRIFPSALIAKTIQTALQQPPPATAALPETDNERTNEHYYIHNAGLILLTPFLPQFLRNCGAADATGILDEGYAAALLEYLATGRTGVEEHEMMFNKILCGIATGRPIEIITTISPEHVSEAENLLLSVIANWPALKNTSIHGLQASFLHRPGKLSPRDEDGNWLLQVERQSYDEWLLGELPWGYQVTGIPFGKHKKLIWTEWI